MTEFYNDNTDDLAKKYLSKTFDEMHQRWSQFLSAGIVASNNQIQRLH